MCGSYVERGDRGSYIGRNTVTQRTGLKFGSIGQSYNIEFKYFEAISMPLNGISR